MLKDCRAPRPGMGNDVADDEDCRAIVDLRHQLRKLIKPADNRL